MKENFLIYGCYGYTGQLISEYAVKIGLKPVLAGRDSERVKLLAQQLNLEYRVFDLSDDNAVVQNIKDFKVVLHCAGPFKYTAQIMAKACIQTKTHYLDITGEYHVFEQMFSLNNSAEAAGVLLMPGVGFDVVPSDCLAVYLKEKMPNATSLELALYNKGGSISQGTAITVADNLGESCVIRQNGKLVYIPNGKLTREILVDGKKRICVAIAWGDVATAYRSTGIPNIIVYNFLPQRVIDSMKLSNYIGFILRLGFVKRYLVKKIKSRPAGPGEEQRSKARSIIWGEVKNALGVSKRATLELPEGYTLTAYTAVKIAQSILEKDPPSGTRTPGQVFGKDFILQFDGVSITDAQPDAWPSKAL